MPMIKGSSPQVISKNIQEMVDAGHPHDQAVAASLSQARKHAGKILKKYKGGEVGQDSDMDNEYSQSQFDREEPGEKLQRFNSGGEPYYTGGIAEEPMDPYSHYTGDYGVEKQGKIGNQEKEGPVPQFFKGGILEDSSDNDPEDDDMFEEPMSKGGMVKKMNKGGMAFASALKMKRGY